MSDDILERRERETERILALYEREAHKYDREMRVFKKLADADASARAFSNCGNVNPNREALPTRRNARRLGPSYLEPDLRSRAEERLEALVERAERRGGGK